MWTPISHFIDMDDEDGRCLLDVICDPQALNDFLHGSEKIDSDDLLDNTGDAASAFFEGAGLHVQETSGNHLNTEQSQPTTSVDLDFLEDDILGSPSGGGANLQNSDQPCDILQQSLQEANITEQTLEAEAELDLGSFQLPTLQPVVHTASDGTPQIFSGGADLIGLQQPAVLTHQALVQQSVGADVVNKAISVQPFLQQVGLGNVTIQPISNLQGLPNGSPSGALGIGQIQVVGQQVMAINQPTQQIIAKQVQPSQVATMPVGSYITQTAPEQQQVTLASAGVSPQNAGLMIPKNLPAVATTTLNGSSMFGSVSAAQGSQPLTVTSNLSSSLVQAQNVIIHRTPTPIQPKPAGVLQQKLYQITPKPFGPNNTTLTLQNEAALQQQKAQQNLTFMAGKAGQNVVLSGFPPGLPANMFKQPPPQQQTLNKPMSVHLLNQGSSIVIPAQHVPQAMLQGQNQFLLPGQLTGTSTVQIPQQLSALQANMGGQILTTSHPSGQTHIITSQGPGGQLITNQALPAQILTNQNLASQLNLGQVLTSQNAHGTAHILSAPIQLQPGQVGQPTLFQMPVSLAGSLTTQSQPTAAASLAGGAINHSGQTVIQGVTLPSQVAMLNATESLNQTVTIQAPPNATSQSPGLIQPQSASSTNLLPSDQANILTAQSTSQPSAPPQLQLNVQQQTPPPQQQAQIPVTSQSSPNLVASSPEKIILGQTAAGTVISQDSMQMFLQQKDQSQQQQQQQQQQQFYSPALKMQQESSMNDSGVPPHLPMPLPIYSIATTALSTTSSVPASVIVSSSVGAALQPPASRELNQSHNLPPVDSKVPQFSTGPSQQALACQLPSGQQKLPGASPSHSLPHPSLGESPQLQPTHLSQIQSPHQSRPPSQPQPLSRPPSRPHSRPPSQPQTLSRPPSEPLSRSCTPQTQMQNLYVIQNQIASSPHGSNQHPLRPPSQPQVPFQAPQAQPEGPPQLATPPHLPLQIQLAPQLQPHPEAQARLQPQIQASSEVQHTHSPHFQLQFPAQGPVKPPTPTQTLHLAPEQQRSFQMVSSQFQALSTIPVPVPQQKQLMDRFQQVPQGIILQTKQSTSTSQVPSALSQFSSQSSSVLVSSQGQQLTMATTPAQAPAVHGHTPVPTTIQSSSTGPSKAAPVLEKGQVPRGTTSGGGGGGQQPPAQCTAVLQQQTPVLVKSASASIAAPVPAENKTFSSSSTIISGGKTTSGQGKATIPHVVQQSVQAKPGVISSASGLNLGKGQLQLQVVGKGLSQVMSSAPAQIQQQYDNKLGSLKKAPPMLQPSKEACFLEQLHKHQGAVLHPDYKTSFRSFEDAFQRLLPYHVYQGTLPSPHDYRKDEEFEMVSTQLLKRTQAMLNKYRLLLLEESRRVSPSAEMVMIDRMFIQEEKTTLALDKQLAKEKPDEYVSSSSRSQSFAASSAAQGSLPSHVPLTSENLKSPPVQMPTHINPTKLVIKHSGGSPSVTWAKASPSLDGDDDALPSRSRPPIKTYEARSRIGLKLKIKQEAGLSKVVHNTALDPIHQTPPPVCTVIKTADQHSSTSSMTTTTATTATASMAGQMNGTVDHIGAAPMEKKPMMTYCRLPLRKTYRENVDAFVAEKAPDASLKGSVSKSDPVPSTLIIKQDGGSRSVITSHKSQGSPSATVAEKSRSEENTKHTFFNRSDARSLVMQGSPAPPKTDDSTSGLMKELAEVEDEFYQRMIKTEPLDHGPASELAWEVPLPPAKRRKSESFDVDNASFSSDSPPDDSLNEHLQSAIDSILNLQQPQVGSQNTRTPSSSYNSSSSPFSSPVHRTDTYLAPNHNGGLGTRTLNR